MVECLVERLRHGHAGILQLVPIEQPISHGADTLPYLSLRHIDGELRVFGAMVIRHVQSPDLTARSLQRSALLPVPDPDVEFSASTIVLPMATAGQGIRHGYTPLRTRNEFPALLRSQSRSRRIGRSTLRPWPSRRPDADRRAERSSLHH